MDERQVAENILNALGLDFLMVELENASIDNGMSMLTIISLGVEANVRYELKRADEIKQRKERKNQRKKRNIYNNNKENKTKENKLSTLNLNIQPEKSLAPLEAKRQAIEKKAKKDRKTSMPKAWVDAREKETLDDQVLILYAEGQGYDWYGAKALFLAFVDHHQAKGSKFVKWESAFYTWIRNDIKWKGPAATQAPESVVQCYKSENTIGELFNDK